MVYQKQRANCLHCSKSLPKNKSKYHEECYKIIQKKARNEKWGPHTRERRKVPKLHKNCLTCNNPFETGYPNKKFCGDYCFNMYPLTNKKAGDCLVCNKKFIKIRSNQTTCASKGCKDARQRYLVKRENYKNKGKPFDEESNMKYYQDMFGVTPLVK